MRERERDGGGERSSARGGAWRGTSEPHVLSSPLQIYPTIVEFAKVRIIELSDHLLSTYDREISKYTDAQVK